MLEFINQRREFTETKFLAFRVFEYSEMNFSGLQAQNDDFSAIFNLEDYKGRLCLASYVFVHYIYIIQLSFQSSVL